ncbi:MAG: RecQ family ATP-dependent DNA helicase [bacterium]|nr:RecQ family ATP-dependent DNA helicase [bacterium]
MPSFDDIALQHLRDLTANPNAEFRDGQSEAIEVVVADEGRALVVQRTGWGKSAVYFIATKMLRQGGAGPTVIVSPLLVLMRNQIEMANRLGIRAETVNSTNRDVWDQVFERIAARTVDLLLISPERLNNIQFRTDVMPHLLENIGLLVIDEVHCISDWGHDFRPDYRRLRQVVDALPPNVPVLGTTATANSRVVDDVRQQLGADLFVLRGPLERDSLSLHVLALPNKAERMAWLAEHVPQLPGAGIVYCLTVADANRVAEFLRTTGIDAHAYTGPMDHERRLAIEQRLAEGDIKVVVATSALAMGYDNPKIEFVIHYQTPGSPVAYYQQVGRAGRAVDKSVGVALSGHEDTDIQDWFINTAFPPEQATTATLDALGNAGGMRLMDLEQVVNLRRGRLDAMLKILEVEGAVYREGSSWYRSARPWTYPTERIESVIEARRAEQAAMAEYVSTGNCLMEFLRHQLGDPAAAPCGRCANCTGNTYPTEVDPELVESALRGLRSEVIEILPRRQAPAGLREELNLKAHNITAGRALTRWGDPGLARQVEVGKFRDNEFADALVDAMAAMIQSWAPDPTPLWVTSVPSQAHPQLISNFAEKVAAKLGLPYLDTVRRARPTDSQKAMQNSFQQARNAIDAFSVHDVRPDPVLLIDDTVDTRWTFTVVGSKLRNAGSGPVYAVALAEASNES